MRIGISFRLLKMVGGDWWRAIREANEGAPRARSSLQAASCYLGWICMRARPLGAW